MLDYLLEEKNFTSLKEYIEFLDSLPLALEEIRRFSESFQRQGHQMVAPPDAKMLAQAATSNKLAWKALKVAIPALGHSSAKALNDACRFIDEFRDITPDPEGLRAKITSIDPQYFSLGKVTEWSAGPPKDVIDLMKELCNRLYLCENAIAAFKRAVIPIGATLHGIFVRFIESISIDLCSCDGPMPKIEAYYTLGRIGLPGMQYDPRQSYSEAQRLDYARAHLMQLRSMRIKAASAVDNLNDFCYRLQHHLTRARRMLQASHPLSTWSRSNGMLTLAEGSLNEVKDMSDSLLLMARKLKA